MNLPIKVIAALASSVGNLYNPPTLTGGVNNTPTKTLAVIRHIRIVNKTAGAVTYSLYVGATGGSAAGTEFMGNAKSVAANSVDDWYGELPLTTSDFLTGVASAATSLTIEIDGDLQPVY